MLHYYNNTTHLCSDMLHYYNNTTHLCQLAVNFNGDNLFLPQKRKCNHIKNVFAGPSF